MGTIKQERNKGNLDRSEVFLQLSEAFQHVEREAMVYVIIETMHRYGIGLSGKIKVSQVINVIQELGKEKRLHFMFISCPDQCTEEMFEMVEEGMLKAHVHKKKLASWTIEPENQLAEVVGKFIE